MEEDRSAREEQRLRDAASRKKRKKRNRKLAFWLLVLLLLAGGLGYYYYTRQSSQAVNERTAATVRAETTVQKMVYTMTIDVSGYVEPLDTQEAMFRSTGPVTGIYVKEGDYVKEGQLLATIDNTSQTASLQSIRNEIEEAELTGSVKELELLKLQEVTALNNLDYTNIYANFDGIVTSVDVNPGDYFDASDRTAVLTIVDISSLIATVEVDEIDMMYVEEGMGAELTFYSYPERSVNAYISYIPMLGRYDSSGIGVVDVELTIEDPPAAIRPGYTFEGVISVEGDVEMLIIPQAAVTTTRGGITTVKRKTADGEETVTVNVKNLGEGLVQILSDNIKEGDVLLYEARSTTDTSLTSLMSGAGTGGPPPGAGGGGNPWR